MKRKWWVLVAVPVAALVLLLTVMWISDRHRRTPLDEPEEQNGLALERQQQGPRPAQRLAQDVHVPKTQREFATQQVDFFRRFALDGYGRFGRKDERWDASAEPLLEMFAHALARSPDEPTDEEFMAAAQPLIDADCDDPMVSVAVAMALYRNDRSDEAVEFAFRVNSLPVPSGRVTGNAPEHVKRPPLKDYSSLLTWQGNLLGGYACDVLGEERYSNVEPSFSVALGAYCRGVEERWIEPGDERVVYAWLRPHLMGPLGSLAGEVIRSLSQAEYCDPWLKEIVLGHAEIKQAWVERGTGWGYEVTSAGRQGFEEHLAKAREQPDWGVAEAPDESSWPA